MNESIVVLGASGAIGREVVTQLTARGHHVIAIARDAARLEALYGRVADRERLTVLRGSVASDDEARKLVDTLRALGRPVSAAVAALRGRVDSGRLLQRRSQDFLCTLDSDVNAHFVAAKHFIPLLAESGDNGLYLLLGGPMGACAWSGYGHLSVASAALQMLTQVLREEAKDSGVAVQQLQIERRDRQVPIVQFGTYSKPEDRVGLHAPRHRRTASPAAVTRSHP
jgi:NAD(P)-dependent dehydrogenase (short-subunit alcohol dehydrogenase family)